MSARFDVIVVGAGLQGLAAAKTFLQINPDLKLAILDANSTIGGVWAQENIYSGLRSNNLLGTYEFTDFPMDTSFDVEPGQHIRGETIHHYLSRYASNFKFTPLIRLRTKVLSASKVRPEGWCLSTKTTSSSETRILTCTKLVVATGLTSQPLPLPLPLSVPQPSSTPVLSFSEYPRYSPPLHKTPEIKHVTVCGGGKAAHDLIHLLASSGKRVTWLLRKSGHGATYMSPAYLQLGPFGKFWLEKVATTRLVTWVSPCIWGPADGFGWVRRLFHQTRLGRAIVSAIWAKMGGDVVEQSGLGRDEKCKDLVPKEAMLWYGAGISILNYSTDIYDFVRNGQVDVISNDVKYLESGGVVRFEDGTELKTDAIVCSTGWDWSSGVEFHPSDIHADLGIPSRAYTPSQRELWAGLDARADREILARFPMLEDGPKLTEDRTSDAEHMTGWRLFRGIAPPSPSAGPPDIVFLGMVHLPQSALRSEVGSLWAYAYLYGKLVQPLDSIAEPSKPISLDSGTVLQEERLYDAALFNRFGRWRTPFGMGARHPDLTFDGIPYFDLLLRDLGMRRWRKGWGVVGEVFGGGYAQGEYRGLVEEWLDLNRKDK